MPSLNLQACGAEHLRKEEAPGCRGLPEELVSTALVDHVPLSARRHSFHAADRHDGHHLSVLQFEDVELTPGGFVPSNGDHHLLGREVGYRKVMSPGREGLLQSPSCVGHSLAKFALFLSRPSNQNPLLKSRRARTSSPRAARYAFAR